jgi:transposase-like protein
MNLIDVTKQFGNVEACTDFLEAMRWPNGVECLQCGKKEVTKYVKRAGTRTRVNRAGKMEQKPVPERILYTCRDCGRQFSVTTGTIFHDTHLPLEKWFLAVALMVNAKKGLSALQMKRDMKVAYKTAWYLNHRIRKAMGFVEVGDEEPLKGVVEADETYIRSKKYDKHRKPGPYERSRCSA